MREVIDGIQIELADDRVAVGVVIARGCLTEPATQPLHDELTREIEEAKARTAIDAITSEVRDMLRFGKYKPTGRGKPASEYLHRSALEDRFPRINNLVDINNLISLQSLLPISLVDLVRAKSDAFVVRRGRANESFVFNAGGQVIDVEDLLVVARLPIDEACANPVKDSMATKLNDASSDVMAVLYAPRGLVSRLREATSSFARALSSWGGAKKTAFAVLAGQAP
jgi:DNA/RNA-binding domain of Phe-tRNA-synthetase-like protein